jgi:hypothetical protein
MKNEKVRVNAKINKYIRDLCIKNNICMTNIIKYALLNEVVKKIGVEKIYQEAGEKSIQDLCELSLISQNKNKGV